MFPTLLLLAVFVLGAAVCGPAAHGQDRSRIPVDRLPAELPLDVALQGLPGERSIPADNALTPERVQLGRRMFFDARLSGDGTLACASCHLPEQGFASPDPRAIGVADAVGRRNAPSLLNRVYGTSFFWDGRVASLEEQALEPIENPDELNSSVPEVLDRLREDPEVTAAFESAYEGGLTADNLARALASFERVLVSGDSPFDRFHAADSSALTDSQRQGLWLFDSRGGCWKCHNGPNLTDEDFHNTGVSWGLEPLDLGRFEVTEQDEDRGKFRTPGLRDIARTAPYMHDGSMATLREVVEFYNKGGGENPYRDPRLQPLNLTPQDVDNLVAFLESLTGPQVWVVEDHTSVEGESLPGDDSDPSGERPPAR